MSNQHKNNSELSTDEAVGCMLTVSIIVALIALIFVFVSDFKTNNESIAAELNDTQSVNKQIDYTETTIKLDGIEFINLNELESTDEEESDETSKRSKFTDLLLVGIWLLIFLLALVIIIIILSVLEEFFKSICKYIKKNKQAKTKKPIPIKDLIKEINSLLYKNN